MDLEEGTMSEAEMVRRQVESENRIRVESMTDEERQREREELIERFGDGILGLMERRRKQREADSVHRSDMTGEPLIPGQSTVENDGEASGMKATEEVERVRRDVWMENEAFVRELSAAEWESEVKDLEERFGKTTLEALKRRAEKRSGGTDGISHSG